ncbi:hypothetical protein GGTG_13199 [Gaeumannomyces tritici R3-111a-1]|uniref:Uncharacterized protein n=1 Tax=Gaeumannomyces tritici (strain R3-111a-1) TaxID=644352 RepID=J3PI71_GAET3|nr:hypothetical protein GGTG_13199 [Gaeumannomyces tritici R3-111a-1]EJT69583.1 hypothetical protein GGTG_13199 [Gaeumannomyces tritici R3-111a-1]
MKNRKAKCLMISPPTGHMPMIHLLWEISSSAASRSPGLGHGPSRSRDSGAWSHRSRVPRAQAKLASAVCLAACSTPWRLATRRSEWIRCQGPHVGEHQGTWGRFQSDNLQGIVKSDSSGLI